MTRGFSEVGCTAGIAAPAILAFAEEATAGGDAGFGELELVAEPDGLACGISILRVLPGADSGMRIARSSSIDGASSKTRTCSWAKAGVKSGTPSMRAARAVRVNGRMVSSIQRVIEP